MPSETGSRLKQLGLALLNATLMLVALVLLLAVVLVWQLRGLADEVRTGLRTDLAAMQGEVQAARTEAREALAALDDPERAGTAREDLRALVTRLEALDPAAVTPDASEETASLFHRLALAIIAVAAQGLAGQGPAR